MAFHPEDRVVASCSEDRSIKLWNLDDGGLLSTMNVESSVCGVAFSKDGTTVAAGCYNGKIHFMDAAAGQIKSSVTGHENRVSSVQFSPDGKRLVSGSYDKTVMVWDPSTGEQLCQLTGHTR